MKKILAAATLALVATGAAADGWRFAPLFTDKNFKLDPTLALNVGSIDPKGGNSDTAWGVDFNFNCGLLQDPQNRMRTHVIVSQSDDDNVERTAFELSPRYTVPLGGGWSAGVGPSLGAFKVRSPGVSATYFGAGIATGINYRAGAYYAGTDLRYHATENKDGRDADHLSVGIKVGVNF